MGNKFIDTAIQTSASLPYLGNLPSSVIVELIKAQAELAKAQEMSRFNNWLENESKAGGFIDNLRRKHPHYMG